MGRDARVLRVRLLGGLVVEGIDERELGSRKARLLLKRLALARGHPVAGDELIDILWSDAPPARPGDQLGVLVSRLRRVLGADAIPHRGSGYALVIDWLDVDELALRLDEAVEARADDRLAAARAAAGAAVALARGSLLPDDEGAWLDGERAWAAANVARAHHIGAEAALASGDPDAAAAACEAALLADPYDETALRILMRAHAAAGRPASGLAAYVRVRDRLAEDLGVGPAKETERIHDELVMGDLVEGTAPARPSAITLVGRDRELAALAAGLTRARDGEAVGVTIRGEAGIGKSALVQAWRASIADAVIVECWCDPLGRDLPLQPIVDGLARHLDALGPAAASMIGEHDTTLSLLLGDPVTGSGATVARDPEFGRARLFAALLAVLSRLGDAPIVLIVEDIHFAGSSTFEWISFALRRGRRLLIVTTTRSTGVDVPGTELLDLPPLPPEAAARLVRGIPHGRDVDEVVARSEGNPLFLLALAEAPGGSELPVTVREAVDRQAAMLGPAAATVRTAAIIGSAIDLDLLADVMSSPAGEVLADLELACGCGLLEERASGLAFRHELVREALDSGAGSARRALVHRDVARALVARAPRDPLEIAVHARLGGDLGLAVDAFVRAAEAAAARFDVGAALAHLQSALDLAPDATAHAVRARIRLSTLDLAGAEADAAEAVLLGGGAAALEISAWVAYYRRRYEQARAFADAGAEQADDPALELSCRAVGGRVRHGAGDLAGALGCLEGGVAAVGSVRGVADVWLGSVKVHQGRPRDALEIVQRALSDPYRLAHPWAAFHGRFARVMALGQLGRVEEGLAGCDELEQARLRAGVVGERFIGIADNARGWLLRNIGRLAEADECNEWALAAHAEREALSNVGFTEAYWVALLDLIDGRLLAGDVDGARRRLAEIAPLDSWEGTMAWHQRHRLNLMRARLALLEGQPDRGWALADAVRIDAAERGARRYELLAAAWRECCDPNPDRERVGAVVEGLQACARLEGWRLTAMLADRLAVDEWRRLAERSAGAVVAASGPHRDSATRWVEQVLSQASAS